MTKLFSLPTALLLFLFFLPAPALAQTASITGTVTDSTGAVIPGTKVSAQNKTTNASRTTLTDGSGTYRITNLPPGIYGVVIEKPGFKAMEYSRVELTVDQVQNLDATLAPSSVAEKVTVTAPLAPVDLNDAQIGEMVKSQQVENLPLILRDPYQLILLSPGAIQGNSILQGLSVNGSRERNNNFLLDGTDNNDAEIPGLTLPQPGLTSLNPDSVQEFRVITSSFLPEFGRNTGAVIDIVSKRGTNDFHSDVYWFGRYDALGARDFFNHQVTAAGQVAPKDFYARNTFGIALGGPIERDKTFWFANYDGECFVTTLTNTAIVPTPAFKTPLPSTGEPVFTITRDAKGSPLPSPVTVDLSSPQNVNGLPLDPTIQKILASYPAPNGPSVDDVRGLLFFPSKSQSTGDNFSGRLDHNFSASETLAVRYTFNRYEDPNFDHTDFLPGLGGTGTLQRKQNASVQLTSVIDPRLVNNLRLGANRINFPLNCQGLQALDNTGLADPFGRGVDLPLPGVAGFGCLLIVDRDSSKRFSGTYTIGDDVTWARGQHTFKFGVEARDVYSNSTNDFLSRPTVDFNNFSNFGGAFAFQTQPGMPVDCNLSPQSVDCNATLQNMVWSLFGTVGSVTQAQFFDKRGNRTPDDLRGFRQKEFSAFAQDTFKVLPNLTLNYGLRYQFNGVPYEVNNLLSTLFTDPSGQAPFTFSIAGQKDQGLPPLYNNDWHDFEPRVGIAWDPFESGKTSIRAGYGIFHDRLFGQLLGLTRGNPPFQQDFFQPFFGSPPCTPPQIQSPVGLCIGPGVSSLPIPPSLQTTSAVPAQSGILPFIIAPHLRMPYSQGWNFGVQRELPGSLLLEVNYVGSRGTRLLRLVDGNPPQPALVSQLIAGGIPPQLLQFNTLYFGAEEGLLPFDPVNNNAFFHAEVFNNAASSVYHALQANITKHMSNGLAVQAAYTWSHAIDNSSDPLTPATGNQGFPRDSLNLAAERGNSDFDVRQRLTINYSWDLPLGNGHAHLAEGWAGSIFGGWEVAGITTFSGGLPYDIFTATDTAHTGQPQRPDFNPAGVPATVGNPLTQTGPNLGMSSALFFPDAPFGRGGDLGRNRYRGPGINNWDAVLQKTVGLSERVNLLFRAETYNLFNRVQFSQPGNLTSDPLTFGQSTSQVRRADDTSGARQIQFGMKLQF